MKKYGVYLAILIFFIALLVLSYELYNTKQENEQNELQTRERAIFLTFVDLESSFHYLIDALNLEGFSYTDYEKKLLQKALSREASVLNSLRSNIHFLTLDSSKEGFEAGTTMFTFLLKLSQELSSLASGKQVNVEKIQKYHALLSDYLDGLRTLIEVGQVELLEEDNLRIINEYFQDALDAMK